MDLFGRKIVGWSLGNSLATELVADALRQSIEARRPDGKQLLHHSDRGCQYTSDAYQQKLRTLGIVCSMSRTGNCVFKYIETFYNAERLHQTLGYQSPTPFEGDHAPAQAKEKSSLRHCPKVLGCRTSAR